MKKSLHDLYEITRFDFGNPRMELYSFLMSFNQDTESFEQGLNEIIEACTNNLADPNKNELRMTIKGIEEFLDNKDYTDEEKESFVNDEIDLDINVLKMTHLQWISQVVLPEMKKNL